MCLKSPGTLEKEKKKVVILPPISTEEKKAQKTEAFFSLSRFCFFEEIKERGREKESDP